MTLRPAMLVALLAASPLAAQVPAPTYPIGFPGNTGGSTEPGAGTANQAPPAEPVSAPPAVEPQVTSAVSPGFVAPVAVSTDANGMLVPATLPATAIPGDTNANSTPIPGNVGANNTAIPGVSNVNTVVPPTTSPIRLSPLANPITRAAPH